METIDILKLIFTLIFLALIFIPIMSILNEKNKDNELLHIIPNTDENHILIKLNKKRDEIYDTIQEVALDMNLPISTYPKLNSK